MAKNESCIKQQVKNRIIKYNRQRIGVAILTVILMAFLLVSSVIENGALFIHLVILCSLSSFLLAAVFVLSFRQASGLFLATTLIMAAFFALNKIRPELFLTLALINAGNVFDLKKIYP
jgi:hypothetical protein